jgi:hypothetical protein
MKEQEHRQWKNTALYQIFLRLIHAGFNLLLLYEICIQSLPHKDKTKIVLTKDGNLKVTTIRVPDFFRFVESYKTDIQLLDEFDEFHSAIKNDNIASQHFDVTIGTFLWRDNNEAIHFVILSLAAIVEEFFCKRKWNEELVEKIYDDLEQFMYNDTLSVIDIVPLDNFNSELENIPIDRGLLIRKITTEEKEMFVGNRDLLGTLRVMSWKYVVEFRYDTKKLLRWDFTPQKKTPPAEAPENVMPILLTALRLFKKGLVHYRFLFGTLAVDYPFKWYTTRPRKDDIRLIVSQDAREESPIEDEQDLYVLRRTEICEFKEFWDRVKKIHSYLNPRLFLALRRLNYVYGREVIDDRIIDYAVAFEALFSRRNDGLKIGKKLSNRIARLVSNEETKRSETRKEMNSLHEARNKIVHGNEEERQQALKQVDVGKVEEHLRNAIKLYVNRVTPDAPHDEIIGELNRTR